MLSLSLTVAGESVRHFQSVGVLSWKPAAAAVIRPVNNVTVIIHLRIVQFAGSKDPASEE